MAEIGVLESILSLGVQTFLDILWGRKLHKVVHWITTTLCGRCGMTWKGWRKCFGGMLLSLPLPIRSWLTSRLARIESKHSICLVGSPTKGNFSALLTGNQVWGAPATFGLFQWMWITAHYWSICDTYCAFFFFLDLFKHIYAFKKAHCSLAMC